MKYQEHQDTDLVSQLIQIALLVAIIFVVLTVVLLVLGKYSAATVFLVIALAAAVLAAVGVVLSHKRQGGK